MIYLISISFLASALIIGNAAFSVCLGVAFSFFYKPEIDFITRRVSTIPLQIGIVILGLTIGLGSVYEIGENYLSWITLFVFLSFFGGLLISRIFSLDKTLSILISSGAAICGATAIAAVAPIIKAKPHELVIALTTIFIFNIIALISFPYIGSALSLTEVEFGSSNWGTQISENWAQIFNNQWWPTAFPAIAIASLAVSVNLISDGLLEVFEI